MPTTPVSVQVRIEHFNEQYNHPTPTGEERFIFWQPYIDVKSKPTPNQRVSIDQLEYKVYAELGAALKAHLINHTQQEIVAVKKDFLKREEAKDGQNLAAVSSAEMRDYDALREKRRVAASVIVGVKIESYSSLNLALLFGGAEQLAHIFDSNFDLFRVFLDAYIPIAFADVFGEEFAGRMRYNVDVPQAMEDMFYLTPPIIQNSSGQPNADSTAPVVAPNSKVLDKAQWAWRLANYSLLVPFLLALFVMYYAVQELSSVRNAQVEALKPILEHQINLLKEDRERFNRTSELEQILIKQLQEKSNQPNANRGTVATSDAR
jgi:hypothetical protein